MSDILQGIGSVITAVLGWITSAINNVVALFYTAPSGTQTSGSFTFLGVLLLVSFAIGMVWTLINFIRGLVRRG